MAKKDRSNAYFFKRLQQEFPKIYDDYEAGKFSSPRQAFIAAGYVTEPDRLQVLRKAWRWASFSEKAKFLAEIGAVTPTATLPSIIDAEDRLLPEARTKLIRLGYGTSFRSGHIMKQIGGDPLNASLGGAMHNNSTIDRALAAKIAVWLNKQE